VSVKNDAEEHIMPHGGNQPFLADEPVKSIRTPPSGAKCVWIRAEM